MEGSEEAGQRRDLKWKVMKAHPVLAALATCARVDAFVVRKHRSTETLTLLE